MGQQKGTYSSFASLILNMQYVDPLLAAITAIS